MGLIKSTSVPTLSTFSMKDIENHAKAILLRARQQAEQLLAAAQTEAEGIRIAAKAEGLAQGQQEGIALGMTQGAKSGEQQALAENRAQLQQAMAALAAAASALDSNRADLEAAVLADVVQLAIAIARRVTKRQGLLDPSVLSANLQEVMKMVMKAADVRVAIHPSQRKTLDDVLPQLQVQWPTLRHVQVIEDASVESGGCRVFTEQGEIEATLGGQLDRIAEELLPVPQEGIA
jgi:flagellar assembly protein FliH